MYPGREQTIRSGDHDDGVLAIIGSRDLGHSARTGHHLHRVGIDPSVFQAGEQPLGEKIGPEASNHVHRSTEFRDAHGLVGALSPVEHIEAYYREWSLPDLAGDWRTPPGRC